MASLNNNQVAEVVNLAIKMATGAEEVGQLDLQGIVDTGNDPTIIGSQEAFTKALINVLIRRWYTDSSYRSEYFDPFFEDSEKFGAILSCVAIEVPEVKASSAWTNITSGSTKLGEYVIYLPVVHEQYYGKSVSWELPVAVTGTQWDTAFHTKDEIRGFVVYLLLCIDNAMIQHMEDMNAENRNNFMAEKIAYAKSETAKGVHVVNLVKKYAEDTGKESFTVKQFLADSNALLYASGQLRLFKGYFRKMSTVFNTAGYKRFTPDDRLVIQVLSQFEERMETVALSDTFHKDIVEMPKFQSVACWQGIGSFDFDEVSSINVKIGSDGTAIEQSGIVAFMCDKWAIMHTIVSKRVAAKPFEPEDIIQYYYQTTDKYMNNLTMNAVIFTLEDYEA